MHWGWWYIGHCSLVPRAENLLNVVAQHPRTHQPHRWIMLEPGDCNRPSQSMCRYK